jgi:hypothetical protein
MPNWTCVGRVSWPNATLAATTLRANLFAFTTGQPVADAGVTFCRFSDPMCNPPVATAQSDPSGLVVLNVPAQHVLSALQPDSFAQITSPTTATGLYFMGYPVTEPVAPLGAGNLFLLALPPNADAGNNPFAPYPVDPMRGELGFGVFDCNNNPSVPGVQVAIDPIDPSDTLVHEYYLQETSALSFTATATSAGLSAGGFINVPPGIVNLTATPLGLNKPSSRARVLVRAGTFTQAFLFPTP